MVDYKVVWSHRARIRLYAILEFYAERNKSKTYSAKLYKKFHQRIALLAKFPTLGVKTELEFVRAMIVDDYFIYYEVGMDEIQILTIWDARQNPDNLIIK